MPAIPWRRLLRALVLCALIPVMNAGADAESTSSNPDAIREGNRAFRGGNYEAAISRYLASHPQAPDGAVARFNLGVAYYRLGDYAQAELWLLRSARDARFSSKARYNLGLVYWARGDTRGARSEFKAVERFSGSRKLRSLAHQGLLEVYRGADAPALRRPRSAGIDEGYSIRASMSYGNDDNVFHSPGAPYLDLTQPGPPLVTPKVASGSFAEADVTAQSVFWSGRHVLLRAAYDFDGRYYTDRQFQNADEYSHRLSVSARKVTGPELDRKLLIRMSLGHHDETNFDPDNGLERVAAGEIISGRFKYWNSVAAVDYERPFGRVTVAARGMTELRDYGAVENVSEYDNMLFLAGMSARMKVLPRTELKLEYDRSVRKYRERKALNADGTLVATNPNLEYDYDTLSLTALFEFGRTGLEIGYDLSDRTDTYVRYNDYRRGSLRITGSWQPSRRLRLELTGFSSTYDYPNAFAFDVPQGGAKTLDYTQAELRARFTIISNLQLVAAARYWNVESSDPRITYSRFQAPIGLSWTQRF